MWTPDTECCGYSRMNAVRWLASHNVAVVGRMLTERSFCVPKACPVACSISSSAFDVEAKYLAPNGRQLYAPGQAAEQPLVR